eukprot:4357536-Heterocapsa_arctica.AAC.2
MDKQPANIESEKRSDDFSNSKKKSNNGHLAKESAPAKRHIGKEHIHKVIDKQTNIESATRSGEQRDDKSKNNSGQVAR